MRFRWRARWRFRKAATALVALALLPVAFLVGSAHAEGTATGMILGMRPDVLRAQDVDVPMAEALKRSEASNLFAPFAWDGQLVSGPFVAFDYGVHTGAVVGYFAVNGSTTSLLVDTIQINGFMPLTAPVVSGATFLAAGVGVSLVVHDEPMALLEIRTGGLPQTVVLHFPTGATGLAVAQATNWPRSSLSFAVGGSHGRVIVGRGNLSVNGTTVSADLQPDDYLALRAVPAYAEHAAERTAVLEAFATGRLAAELDLVAMSSGGWLENAAQYQGGLDATTNHVAFSHAEVELSAAEPQSGLVLLAFDPQTMPLDAQHRLTVTDEGAEVPEAATPVDSLYSLPGPSSHASYTVLPMNATVLVVYLPDMTAAPLQIESVAIPASGLDWPTEIAMLAAVFVVSAAAAVIFRRGEE